MSTFFPLHIVTASLYMFSKVSIIAGIMMRHNCPKYSFFASTSTFKLLSILTYTEIILSLLVRTRSFFQIHERWELHWEFNLLGWWWLPGFIFCFWHPRHEDVDVAHVLHVESTIRELPGQVTRRGFAVEFRVSHDIGWYAKK